VTKDQVVERVRRVLAETDNCPMVEGEPAAEADGRLTATWKPGSHVILTIIAERVP
jgi:hypothetical protein